MDRPCNDEATRVVVDNHGDVIVTGNVRGVGSKEEFDTPRIRVDERLMWEEALQRKRPMM